MTTTTMAKSEELVYSIVSLRREIHAHPEPGFEEHETSARIKRALIGLAGLPESSIKSCAGTGLVVDIVAPEDSDGSGSTPLVDPPRGEPALIRTIALRADMDALRMTEGNSELPYRSQNEGVAHMCGHDGHMAALVGGAALLARRAARLPAGSRVRLLFQPAEEGPGGALPMLKEGCLEGVDEVYGMHNWPTMPLGQCRVKAGPLMAHVAEFEIVVTGKGVHASQPHGGIDAVLVASALVQQLHTIVSRTLPSSANAVVSVTMLHAGEAFNVLPDTATLGGTIRDLSPEHFETISRRIREIARGVCAAHGASARVRIDGMYPAVVNHPAQTTVVERIARTQLAGGCSEEGLPMMGAEDFSYLTMAEHGGKPGCFFFLGGFEEGVTGRATYDFIRPRPKRVCLPCNPAGGSQADASTPPPPPPPPRRSNCLCHGTSYDFNDNLLPIAIRFWVRLVEARLGVQLYSAEELDKVAR